MSRESMIVLDAFDGKKIYSVWNKAGDVLSDKVVILAHGLTGHANEYLHQMTRIYFNERGYDVVRINFYNWCEGARNLIDTTLEIHGRDLNTLTEYLRKLYKSIFIAGHSYGGLTLLFSQPQVNALAFWDPSFVPWEEFLQVDVQSLASGQVKVIGGGVLSVVGQKMLDEAKSLTFDISSSKAGTIFPSSLVVTAEKETALMRRELYDALKCEKTFYEVKGASHCFNEAMTVQELCEQTFNWFERF